MQYVSVLIASLGVTTTQMYLTWPSPTISILKGDNSPLGEPISSEDSSWIVSIILLSGFPAAFTFHLTTARFCRKQVLHAASVTLFLPWFIIIFANHVAYIYAARILAGLLLGTTIITAAMYSSEIADPDIRGRLGTSYGVMKLSGSIIVLAVGPFVSYTVLAIVCAIVPFTLFCLLFFIPESPYSLVKKQRLDEAREAVIMLSGSKDDIEIDERVKTIVAFVHTAERPLGVKEVFSNWKYVKSMAIVITLVTFEYFGGFNAINSYQQEIIASSESDISPEVSSIVFGLIQIPAAILSAFLVDRLGRKVILYIGCTGCLIPLIAEGVYFYLEDYLKQDVSAISWLPTTGLVIFLISHAVHSSVPYILLGEFFNDKMKNVATTMFSSAGALAVFGVTKLLNL
ncbi:facilitated trehalose transporter Tret1-like isoform X1 [Atheta coriaria]|uniref:facilitated trehalose transporter Tret1-like isoform X1 n=1 Tax=Dalotia coriaria TaxID=877792 RepID=UPI0031F40B4A